MNKEITCFDWQKSCSDFLDGTLAAPLKKESDHHLDTCKDCQERLARYRKLLNAVSARPRKPLPVPIRKSPLSFVFPKLELTPRLSRWDRTPWFIRSGIEGFAIALVILLVIAVIPRARNLYERNLEKRLSIYTLSELGQDQPQKNIPQATLPQAPAADVENDADEFNGEVEDSVHVGNAEIWRFNLKTDSPTEMQPKIVAALQAQGLSASTPGIGGTLAPGGVQFDLLVPKGIVANLKNQLQRIAGSGEAGEDGTFTWYKNRSKKEIPAGKARVVIWLSQT